MKKIKSDRLALAKIVKITDNGANNSVKTEKENRLILLAKYNDDKLVKCGLDIESDKDFCIIENDRCKYIKYTLYYDEQDGLVKGRKTNGMSVMTSVKTLKDLGIKLPRTLNYEYIKYLASVVNKESTNELAKQLVLNKDFIRRTKNKIK